VICKTAPSQCLAPPPPPVRGRFRRRGRWASVLMVMETTLSSSYSSPATAEGRPAQSMDLADAPILFGTGFRRSGASRRRDRRKLGALAAQRFTVSHVCRASRHRSCQAVASHCACFVAENPRQWSVATFTASLTLHGGTGIYQMWC
jgi:hypothetical protein